MKYVVCVPDGCADEPVAELGGRTPLEAAATPDARRAGGAGRGRPGRGDPAGLPPGSDVGNMSIFGYDPARFHTGRAPIEAAALGLKLRARPGRLPLQPRHRRRPTAPWSTSPAATRPPRPPPRSIEALDAALGGDGLEFHPGVQYRHILVAPADWAEAECTPPHDLTDKPAVWPTGAAAPRAAPPHGRRRATCWPTAASTPTRSGCGARASSPRCRRSRSAYGLDAGLVTAVDLVRGLGVLTGIEVVERRRRHRLVRHRLRGQARRRPRRAWPTAPTCSSSTSRPPTRPATPATWRRRSRPSRTGTAASSPAWSRASTRSGPWRMLLLPDHATPLRAARPTPPTRCPTCSFDSAGRRPRGHLHRGRRRRPRAGARPRADGPPRRRALTAPTPADRLRTVARRWAAYARRGRPTAAPTRARPGRLPAVRRTGPASVGACDPSLHRPDRGTRPPARTDARPARRTKRNH